MLHHNCVDQKRYFKKKKVLKYPYFVVLICLVRKNSLPFFSFATEPILEFLGPRETLAKYGNPNFRQSIFPLILILLFFIDNIINLQYSNIP